MSTKKASKPAPTRKSAAATGVTPAAFSALVSQHALGPVYVLAGEDTHAIGAALEQVRAAYVTPATQDFNYEMLHADSESVNAAQITGAADTLPFMGGTRVVLVKHVHELRADELDALGTYCEMLVASGRTDVVLVLAMNELDKRTRFAKRLYDKQIVVEYALGSVQDVAVVARERYGKTLARDAAQLLQEICDGNARAAYQEIEKVCLYAGARAQITREDVLRVCVDTTQRNEWELAEQLLQGDTGAALAALQALRENRTDALYQYAIVATGISRLAAARAALHDGSLYKRFYEFRLGYQHPGRPRVEHYLRGLAEQNLTAALQALAYLDIAAKASALPVETMLDMTCALAAETQGTRR
jgi:DNA polymerase-3 subunit delta